jgi:8-oxo-dGTP pyrophosphatase MutT (NUDIX family)
MSNDTLGSPVNTTAGLPPGASSVAKKFYIKHVFRVGAIIWTKFQGQDYYVVIKSISRPNRGIQIPGGRVERNEDIGKAVIREVAEETGIQTRIVCPLGMIFYQNPPDNYSNLQLFYIVKPFYPIDPTKRWFFTDRDATKQEYECRCISVNYPPEYLAVGQDQVVKMFRQWLKEHKTKN